MNIVNSKPENKLILDVRTSDEISSGKIERARNIPLDDLPSRLTELPKDNEIIVQCETGMRAQMSQAVLSNAGYKSRFLADKIVFVDERTPCCFKE